MRPSRSSTDLFDISVVLNLHREANYLQRTVRSLQESVEYAQGEGLTVELVVVLDRTDDRTRDWVNASGRFSFCDAVTIIEVDNGSLGLSRNSGVEVARGEYISTADADDLVSFNFLAEHYRVARTWRHDKVAVFPQYLAAFGETHHLCRYYGSDKACLFALFDYHLYISRIFIRRAAFGSLRYRHTDHRTGFAYEDWAFNAELAADGYDFAVAANTAIYYRQRPGSLLRESNSLSARIPPPSKLHDPDVLDALEGMASDRHRYGFWTPPDPEVIRAEYLANPVMQAAAKAANTIDPAIFLEAQASCSAFSNLNANAHKAVAYLRACRQLSARDYSDVVLLPYLIAGGAEKYILSVVAGLQDLGRARSILFLTGQGGTNNTWPDRLPPRSDIVDLAALCEGDADAIDLVTLRLVQMLAPRARLHVKASPFGHRFVERYKGILAERDITYYRFSDEVRPYVGETWRLGFAFNHISECLDVYARFVSDHERLVKNDQDTFATKTERWHPLYAACDDVSPAARPSLQDPPRLLWASRVSLEKRPSLLAAIARELDRRSVDVVIEAYGHVCANLTEEVFEPTPLLVYHGAYDGFASLPADRFEAFLYTSAFDGMPNVVLEALASRLPVIGPEIGGIPEAVINGETGWLIRTTGDDEEDARHYVDMIVEALSDREEMRRRGENGRQLVLNRHCRSAFLASLADIFPSAVP